MSRRMTIAVLLLVSASACTKDKEKDAAAEQLKSQRERDSVLAQSKIPGAGGVGKAMTVADSAGGRVQLQDSIAASE
jgi:hypothetical protein